MTVSHKNDYLNYIHGKRVVFVGPSPVMSGKGLGAWIDEFDVVVRTNHFPSVLSENKSLRADYGTRTDVLYTNMQYYHKNRPFDRDLFRKIGLKWLCMKRCRDVDYRLLHRYVNIRVIQKSASHVGKLITSPLMTNIIAYDLSEQIPAEIVITGIDFYESAGKEYSSYVPGYITDTVKIENARLKIGQGVGHDIHANAEYLKDLYDMNVVTMSDFCHASMMRALQ